MQPILEARNLTKSFRNLTAVTDLSFAIQPGDIYGFLGQNGAGKSTTMRMLLGLIAPTTGKVFIEGQEFLPSRRHLLGHIGAIIERPDLYGYLSGWDNLRQLASMSGKRIPDTRLYELLDLVHLRGREKDKVKTYSQGMKQRLGLAVALVHSPSLLILDEPTNGLDPQGIAEMRALIKHLSTEHGKTILISSHLLYEIEQMATRMLIIHKGKKMAEGSVADLLHPEDTLAEVDFEGPGEAVLRESPFAAHIKSLAPGRATLQMHPDKAAALNTYLVEHGVSVSGLRARHSLEAYFLSLTGDSGQVEASAAVS